jgi:hypothetical protein
MDHALDYFSSEVPEGRSGSWTVERVVIPERAYDPLADPRPDCFKFRPGRYTCLRCDSIQFMTDLYDEWWTQRSAITEAHARGGEVLITGLGLGLVAEAILREPANRVTGITLVERSPDVIRLVAPYMETRYPGKIKVVEANAFSWEPPKGRLFTVGWHDIWPDPASPKMADEINQLRERYRPWCDWQGFWPESYQAAISE